MKTETTKATESICEALSAHGEITVSELAEMTGLGRSTVGKALAALETEGRAVRTPGERQGGKRAPDVWSAAGAVEESTTAVDVRTSEGDAEPSDRLAKGALRTLVLEHLQANAGESFTPTAVGKALHRSSGAVGNALDKLATHGAVAKVGDKPRRYAFIDA